MTIILVSPNKKDFYQLYSIGSSFLLLNDDILTDNVYTLKELRFGMERPDLINQSSYSIYPEIIHEWVGDEMVIINLKTDRIFSLNKTGARFFDLLANHMSIMEIKNTLLTEFEVDPENLEIETQSILKKLLDESLIYADNQ